MPKSQEHLVTAPQAVTTETLSNEIGLLRAAMFPGAIGIDVAKDIVPKFSIDLSREALKQERDSELGTAIEVAEAL